MEARVNQSLKEFLRQPHDEKVRELVPNSPRTGESSIGNYVIGVQVNTYSTVKDMTAKFRKFNKFEGSDFRRWQKKMHFLLTTLKVVYVLSTPMPEFVEDETLDQMKP
ncbi:hypothetical protein Tco_1039740 [Tanacetum coccineum]